MFVRNNAQCTRTHILSVRFLMGSDVFMLHMNHFDRCEESVAWLDAYTSTGYGLSSSSSKHDGGGRRDSLLIPLTFRTLYLHACIIKRMAIFSCSPAAAATEYIHAQRRCLFIHTHLCRRAASVIECAPQYWSRSHVDAPFKFSRMACHALRQHRRTIGYQAYLLLCTHTQTHTHAHTNRNLDRQNCGA